MSPEAPVPAEPSVGMPDVGGAVPASAEARRIAGGILEVLAGVRSITDAAVALGVTSARYYALEARALAGLIAACEPRSPGPVPGGGLVAEVERLRAERDRLQAEAARYQTLVRIAQSAFGGPAAPAAPVKPVKAAGERGGTSPSGRPPGRKKRTPTVRALRLARRVRDADGGPAPGAGSTPAGPPGTPSGPVAG